MDEELVIASSEDGDLKIQPKENMFGETEIKISIIDERGNTWNDTFTIKINSIFDSPALSGLPLTAYVELGETEVVNISITDVDTDELNISVSKSWATVDSSRNLVLTPIQSGIHTVEIVINDGIFEVRETLEVIVSAKPDLIIDEIEVTKDGVKLYTLEKGDVVQIVSYIRNIGRSVANNINVQCTVDGVLVGQSTIDTIAPGGLGVSTCDTQFDYVSKNLEVRVEVDSTIEILETNENNNLMDIIIEVDDINSDEKNVIDRGILLLLSSFTIILMSFVALRIGPKKIKREFGNKK